MTVLAFLNAFLVVFGLFLHTTKDKKLKASKVKCLSSIWDINNCFSFSNLNHDTSLKVFCSIVEIVVMPRKIVIGDDWALSGGTHTTQSKSLQSIKHIMAFTPLQNPTLLGSLHFSY